MTEPDTSSWGAFAPNRVIAGMSTHERSALFERLARAGIGRLVTEGRNLPSAVIRGAQAHGLQTAGGIACFSDHAAPLELRRGPRRPVGADGRRRPRMEWYDGIVPTDSLVVDDLVQAVRSAATQPGLAAFNLDFIRWPIHWEIELRDGHPVLDSSFDEATLRLFRDRHDVDIPVRDPCAAARQIRTQHAHAWEVFRCDVITGVARRLTGAIRECAPDVPIGLFIVPGTEEQRRRYAGQDVVALAELVDVLHPMTYHAMLHRRPEWVGQVVTELAQRTSVPVVPVVQVTASSTVAGDFDWGAPFPPTEFAAATRAGIMAGAPSAVAFPAHGLSPAHLDVLTRLIAGEPGHHPEPPGSDR